MSAQYHSQEEDRHFGYIAEADVTALNYESNQKYGPQGFRGSLGYIDYHYQASPSSAVGLRTISLSIGYGL